MNLLRSPSPTFASRPRRLFAVLALVTAVVAVGRAESPAAGEPKPPAFDKDRFYVKHIRDFAPLALEGGDEKEPYQDVLLHAHSIPAEHLIRAARRDVSIGDMLDKRKEFRDQVRFELVEVEGRLKRLKRLDQFAALEAGGIEDLYEAWIFPTAGRGTDPVCVIVSEVPAGLEPADDFTPGVPVVTAGYFFKVLEYPSNQPNPKDPSRTMFRRAPLLLGRGLTTATDLPPATASITDLATLSLVFGGVVLVALVGLALWLRRTDGGTRKAYTNRLRNPYTPPPDDPPVPPAAADPT